jgi:hypothetical protein
VRSHHTVTVIANKAYIYGGTTPENQLASNDIHAITIEHSGKPEMDYGLIPPLPTLEGGPIPEPRTNHAACAFHGNIAVYGGSNENDELIDDESSMWFFSPERKSWDLLISSSEGLKPGPRRNAKLFDHDGGIVLYGGFDATGDAASDLWRFDIPTRNWIQLPTAPASTTNAAVANGSLYLITSDPVGGQLHHLGISSPVEEMAWESFTFPANPIAPGPRARHDGALLPLTTGYGRNYLTYLLGARSEAIGLKDSNRVETPKDSQDSVTHFSDTWALQIPSSDLEMKPAWSLKNAIKPAKIKDAIRHAIGAETGHLVWAEAVLQIPSDKQLEEEDGKLHPGPRAFFGADLMENGHTVVIWGGVDPKGDRIGDGWLVKFE